MKGSSHQNATSLFVNAYAFSYVVNNCAHVLLRFLYELDQFHILLFHIYVESPPLYIYKLIL